MSATACEFRDYFNPESPEGKALAAARSVNPAGWKLKMYPIFTVPPADPGFELRWEIFASENIKVMGRMEVRKGELDNVSDIGEYAKHKCLSMIEELKKLTASWNLDDPDEA